MLRKVLTSPARRCSLRNLSHSAHSAKSFQYHKDLSVPPQKLKSADEALQMYLKDNMRVYIHMAAAVPQTLLRALANMKGKVRGIETVNMSLMGDAPHVAPDMADTVRANAFFLGGNHRKAIAEQRGDYNPVFFSEVPHLFRSGAMPLDVALISASYPDRHGYCSLGVSVENSLAAVQTAKVVICQLNRHMPRTHGDSVIHINHMDAIIEKDEPLPELVSPTPTDVDIAIGKNVAELIPDGACLQMGIGAIPNGVLAQLTNHKDLGIHTEMFSDGVLDLVENGVINNTKKKYHQHKSVATFLMGTRKLYDFVDDNPAVAMLDVAYVNHPGLIARLAQVHAINSCIEIDVTGQVAAESIGTTQYSGVGGQLDFLRGAAESPGGKAIMAVPSVTKRGESRIVPTLKEGAAVTSTRCHIHWVVTEYGAVNLFGKNLRQRAYLLADIAHPKHRDSLREYARKRFGPEYPFVSMTN